MLKFISNINTKGFARSFATIVGTSTFVTYPSPGLEMLRKAGHTVKVLTQTGPSIEEDRIIAEAKGAAAIITIVSDPITKKVIGALKDTGLKIVAAHAVGLDNVDVNFAKSNGIYVSHTPNVLTDAVADQAMGYVLALARHIIPADKYCRDNKWKRIFEPGLFMGSQLADSTIGIIGLGRIGKGLAARASLGFGMKKILYTDVVRTSPEEEAKYNLKFVEKLEDLIPQADFLVSLTPLLPTTRHLINEKTLGLMKPTAYFINNSRGPVVDEKALINVLKNKKIAGAALDVFEVEPNIPKELRGLDNIILSPHLGSATWTARGKMNIMCAEAIIATLEGKPADQIPHLAPPFRK